MRRLVAACLLLAGCASLPARTGCLAGNVHYSWTTRTPQGVVATSNAWCRPDQACPAFQATVKVDETGKITEATCSPEPVIP